MSSYDYLMASLVVLFLVGLMFVLVAVDEDHGEVPGDEVELHWNSPWSFALADPRFRKAVDDGLADVAAGRVTHWREVEKSVDEDRTP